MTFDMSTEKAQELFSTLVPMVGKNISCTITGGECVQLSGSELDLSLIKAMGFKQSTKGFWWKKF